MILKWLWGFVVCVVMGMGHAHAQKVIRGVVADAESQMPLPQASVQIVGTYEGTISNMEGEYVLAVKHVPCVVRFSYIGYESFEMEIEAHTPERQDVDLNAVPLEMDELVVTAEDMGPNIMRKVIAQKKTWWDDLETFRVRAYSRFTYRNETQIVGMAESLSDAYWTQKGGWREVVKDKRETKNINWDFALPAAAAVNLYDDEVEFGGHNLLGVTHPNALSHYDFRLNGRRFLDHQVIYDIEVRPKSKLTSAFVGQVSVLDSVFAMVEAELKPNRAFIFPPPIRSLGITLRQQFSNTGGAFWLPIGYQSEVDLQIGIVGLEFPMIKAQRVSRISDYQINVSIPDSLYAQDRIQVDSVSVARDSLMEKDGVVVPLSVAEQIAFEEIDSTMTLEKVFKPKGFLARFINTEGNGRNNDDDTEKRIGAFKLRPEVWYNRVDGGHLGVVVGVGEKRDVWSFALSGAYNLSSKRWSFSGEGTRRLGNPKSGFLSVAGFRGTDMRYPSRLYDRFATSSQQFFGAEDYFDFYWREGGQARVGYDFRRPEVSLSGGINAERHLSVQKATDWSLWGKEVQRMNPVIQEGDLRSLAVKAVLSGDNDGPAPFFGQRKLVVEMEHSRLGFGSDFDFTQFNMVLDWRIKTFFKRRLLSNVLDVRVVGSTHLGTLPRQRYGILDASLGNFSMFGAFRSLLPFPYEGQKLLGVFWEHNFRTVPFEMIGWDWAVKQNWGILIHGAHGRTWIDGQTLLGLRDAPMYQHRFHQEMGLSLSGIFDLVRVNVTRRLDAPSTHYSFEMSRLF